MFIPFYYDVYRHPHNCKPKPHFKGSHILDESRVVDITDAMGNVRYNVVLSSEIVPDEKGEECIGYWFECVVVFPNGHKDVILRFPENGYDTDYKKVEIEYHKCIEQYKSLVEAEVQDFKDINVYKDKIDYHVLRPDCCMYCRWCRKKDVPPWCNDGHRDKPWLECHNPKNEQTFQWMGDFPDFPNKHHCRYSNYGWQKLPWQKNYPNYGEYRRHDETLNRIHPNVDPLGKCKNFEPLKKKNDCQCGNE